MGDGIENETEGESLTKRERGRERESGPDTHTNTHIVRQRLFWGG